jgi:predicted nicotinamide N-methyase
MFHSHSQHRHAFLHHCVFLLLILIGTHSYHISLSAKQPRRTTVDGIPIHRVPLRFDDPHSPYALAVTTYDDVTTMPLTDARSFNFLATQVWPSARTAARTLEEWYQSTTDCTLCEFGCGPGLPSLTAALLGASQVYATDVDDLALALVRQAALDQGITNRVSTSLFDLTNTANDLLPKADLYLFSDVFENAAVAKGAAHVTARIVDQQRCVWVFAQSDRSQREIFLRELQGLFKDPTLTWSRSTKPTTILSRNKGDQDPIPQPWRDRLWLCDIDETNVFYG